MKRGKYERQDAYSDEELSLAFHCKNMAKFQEEYIKKFGLPKNLMRIVYLWKNRKKGYDVIIPSQVTTTITEKTRDPFPDTGELLTTIIHRLDELIQLKKEQLEMIKNYPLPVKKEEVPEVTQG